MQCDADDADACCNNNNVSPPTSSSSFFTTILLLLSLIVVVVDVVDVDDNVEAITMAVSPQLTLVLLTTFITEFNESSSCWLLLMSKTFPSFRIVVVVVVAFVCFTLLL